MYASSYRFKKKIITCHASLNHPSYSTKSSKIISEKKSTMIVFCLSLKNVRHSLGVCRQFKSKIQVLPFLHQDPLRDNGHWFLLSHRGPLRGNGHRSLYIKTLCKAMVIDFLCHIETLCEAMVIDLFTSRPSTRQWSLISYVTSRPSARQWSLIFGSGPSTW